MNVKQQSSSCSTTLSPNASLNQILCTLSSHFLFHSLCFLCLDYDSGSTNSCQKKKRNKLYSHVTRKIRKRRFLILRQTLLQTGQASLLSIHSRMHARWKSWRHLVSSLGFSVSYSTKKTNKNQMKKEDI